MIYSPWFSNLLAWTFFRWWGLWACDQWYRAHFSWYFEEWPFHFCLQVHAFHKCDSLWPETDNLCIIHDCHTSCDQWSFMEFFSDQWPASFDDIWSFGTSVLSFGDFDTTDWFQANDLSRAWMWAPKLMLCICRFIFIYKLSLCSRLQAVLHAHWNILSNPFCVSYRGVGQLQLHGCCGQHWVVELIKDCLRHYTDIGPQIT